MVDKRTKNFLAFFIVIAGLYVLIIFFGTGIFSPLPYLQLDQFSGKVIDRNTKEPIEGADVLAVYYKETISIAGSNSYAIDAQEVLTDSNGEFKIPNTKKWFALRRGHPRGKLTIFKPGFGTFPGHRDSIAVDENESWPPPEKYIVYELPKLKTKEERRKNLPMRPHIKKRKYNTFLNLVNEEREYLGLDKIPLKGGIEDVR